MLKYTSLIVIIFVLFTSLQNQATGLSYRASYEREVLLYCNIWHECSAEFEESCRPRHLTDYYEFIGKAENYPEPTAETCDENIKNTYYRNVTLWSILFIITFLIVFSIYNKFKSNKKLTGLR